MKHFWNYFFATILATGLLLVVSCSNDPVTESENSEPDTSLDAFPGTDDGVIKFLGRTTDGFSVAIDVPEEVTERGNALRYTQGDLAMINALKTAMKYVSDAEIMMENANRHTTEDLTVVYNEFNCLLRDENGNEIIDPETNMNVLIDNPKCPGEPSYFMVGEYKWSDIPPYENWQPSYWSPLFNISKFYTELDAAGYWVGQCPLNEADYWTGYFNKALIETATPVKLDAKLNISTHDLGPRTGFVTINPDKKVKYYHAAFYTDDDYKNVVLPLIGGNEKYLQWYVTSIYGTMFGGAQPYYQGGDFMLDQMVYCEPEMTYHVIVTGMDSEDIFTAKQCFEHFTFTLPAKSKPAPKVVVTPIEGKTSPYEAWFNVKAPDGDLATAKYSVNYAREWTDAGDTPIQQWVDERGYNFTSRDIMQINDKKGLDFMVTSRANETMRLAVVGYNDEQTPSEPEEGGIADYVTAMAPAASPVSSALFTELQGEWTATATTMTYNYSTSQWGEKAPMSAKVIITDRITCPETLTAEDYALYESAGFSRAETDALYADLKDEVAIFNQQLKDQNRLLCLGFGFEENKEEMRWGSPYDLFTAKDYSAYNNAGVLWDFGPKWFLQIGEGDSVCVPVNVYDLPPMIAWYRYSWNMCGMTMLPDEYNRLQPYGMAAPEVAMDENEHGVDFSKWPRFNVVVSADKNQLDIQSMKMELESESGNIINMEYFPNAMYEYYGNLYRATTVLTTGITMTKGYEGESDVTTPTLMSAPVRHAASMGQANSEAKVNLANGGTISTATKPYPKTPMTPIEGKKLQVIKGNGNGPVTTEVLMENMRRFAEEYRNGTIHRR